MPASLSYERPTLDQPRELVGVEASGDADPQVVAGLDDEGLAGDARSDGPSASGPGTGGPAGSALAPRPRCATT